MTARWTSPPLPECLVCERPTRREVWKHNHGLCSACADYVLLNGRLPRPAR